MNKINRSLIDDVSSLSPKVVIFDLDGTLADTMPVHYQAWHACLNHFGYDLPTEDLARYKGQTAEAIVNDLNQIYRWDLVADAVSTIKEKFFVQFLGASVKELSFVTEVVRKGSGIWRQVIATGGKRENVEITLKSLKLGTFFEKVVTADDGYPEKINPAYYKRLLSELGVLAEDALFLEDSKPCLAAALEAGINGLFVEDYA